MEFSGLKLGEDQLGEGWQVEVKHSLRSKSMLVLGLKDIVA